MHFGTFTLGIAHIQPIAALIAGVLILILPRLLNYIVAIFLILSGLLGLGYCAKGRGRPCVAAGVDRGCRGLPR